MSMNGFFRAFPADAYHEMLRNPARIDPLIWDEDQSADSTDVETAWDVLQWLLDGAGFDFDQQVDQALSNGACFIAPETVLRHAASLSGWSHDKLLEALENVGDEELYHLDLFREDEDGQQSLLEEFDKLAAFYARAAENRHGVIFYLA